MRPTMTLLQKFFVIFALVAVPFSIASREAGAATPSWRGWSPMATTRTHQSASETYRRQIRLQQQQQKQKHQLSNLRAGAMAPTIPFQNSISYYLRVALAGGLAGATGTAVLYPMDSAKTLRQSNPNMYSSVRHALMKLIRSSNNSWHISHAYRGIVPAALGAIPSSALYFGAYESSKYALSGMLLKDNDEAISASSTKRRLLVHSAAAACGNTISSAVFVPKEVIKQQLQICGGELSFGTAIVKVLRERGIGGLYVGYQATLMRNIPSAMLRFVLYEEMKRKWTVDTINNNNNNKNQKSFLLLPPSVRVFAAGAVAGAMSSGIMTPVDVLKTRLATGACPLGVKNCFVHTLQEAGWKGLYAGAGSRMMWSGAFSAIGFGTFELVKKSLGVSDASTATATTATTTGRVAGKQR